MKVQRKEVNYSNNCCELLIASYVMDVTSFNSCSNPMRECISFLWLLKQLDGLKQQKCILSSSGGQKSKIKLLPGLPSLRRLWWGLFLVSSSFWWLQASLACGLCSSSLCLRLHAALSSVSKFSLSLSRIRTFAIGFTIHPVNPGLSHPEMLYVTTFAKTLFPNKVLSFGAMIQPTTER